MLPIRHQLQAEKIYPDAGVAVLEGICTRSKLHSFLALIYVSSNVYIGDVHCGFECRTGHFRSV